MRSKLIELQPISIKNLDEILNIQQQSHRAHHHESADSLLAKIAYSSDYGAIAYATDSNAAPCGYLLAYAAPHTYASGFDSTFVLDGDKDSLYIHDLAISPSYQGHGIARALFEYAVNRAKEQQLIYSTLIAVNGAEDYWIRLGYQIIPEEREELSTYGGTAFFMKREL